MTYCRKKKRKKEKNKKEKTKLFGGEEAKLQVDNFE